MSGRVGAWALALCLAVGGVLCLLPLYVLVVTACKPLGEIMSGTMLGLPRHWTVAPLAEAWSSVCIGAECDGLQRYFWNSAAIAVPASFASVLLGAVNGYALTQWRLPGAHALFGLMLAANFIPYQMVLLPMTIVLRDLGLFGTVEGLILVHIAYGMPYMTLLFRNFYLGVPPELVLAARLDGGRFWPIFGEIILPLSGAMLATALMLQFSAIWNDYLFGLVFGGRSAPVTVALNNLINTELGEKQYNVDMAGVLLTALPALTLYLFAGRWFLRSIVAGSPR